MVSPPAQRKASHPCHRALPVALPGPRSLLALLRRSSVCAAPPCLRTHSDAKRQVSGKGDGAVSARGADEKNNQCQEGGSGSARAKLRSGPTRASARVVPAAACNA